MWLGERPDRPRLKDPFKAIIDLKGERKTHDHMAQTVLILKASAIEMLELQLGKL